MPEPSTDAAPAVERIASPRLAKLTADGPVDPASVAALWAAVGASGTPLVQKLPHDPDHRAVTFVWRGRPADKRVLLVANRIGDRDRRREQVFSCVPGTDVWHLTLRLRSDHRFTYQIAVDGGGVAGPDEGAEQEELAELAGTATVDPLNPVVLHRRPPQGSASVVELPDAPTAAWTGLPAGPRGLTRTISWAGTAHVAARDVHLHETPGVAADSPVLVLSDGDIWTTGMELPRILDDLVAAGRVRPLTVLAIEALDTAQRWLDLTPNAAWEDAVVNHLLPLAARTPSAAGTAIAGQSLGGLTALSLALRRPDVFGVALAQSPSLWWDPSAGPGFRKDAPPQTPWLSTQIRPDSLHRSRFRLDSGLHEGRMLGYAHHFSEAAAEAGADSRASGYNGGHDYLCWRVALVNHLIDLFPGPGSARGSYLDESL